MQTWTPAFFTIIGVSLNPQRQDQPCSPEGHTLPSSSRQGRTAVHTAGSLHRACRDPNAGHPGPEPAP